MEMLSDIILVLGAALLGFLSVMLFVYILKVLCRDSPFFFLAIPLDNKYTRAIGSDLKFHYIEEGLQNIYANKKIYSPDFYLNYKTFKKYFYLNPEFYDLYNFHSRILSAKDCGYIYSQDINCKTVYKIGFKSQLQFLKATKLIVDYKYNKFNRKYQQIQNDKLKLYLENVQEQINTTLNESKEQMNESKILLEFIKEGAKK